MTSPRSVYIAFEAFPRPKGSSSHIASMVAALARRHGPVWLLCCGYGDMPARQVEGGVTLWRHKVYHPNMLRRSAEFSGFVAERLERAGPHVEVCMFRDPWGGGPALAATEATTVFEVNALPSWELAYTYPAFAGNHALRAKIEDLERFCLLECDHVVTVSSVTGAALTRLGVAEEKIAVVPNAASDVFFDARAEACPVAELAEGRWIGYVGSLHPWQGADRLIEALALAADDVPDARLLIVTNGRRQARKMLLKLARKRGVLDRVRLHRPMAPEELAPTLARLRFTTAPLTHTRRNTVQGCCPIKIVESMAAGTPVLASDLRVTRELIAHGRDGWLVAAHDTRAWALALRRLLTDDALVARLAAEARRTAQRRFTREAAHQKLDAVLAAEGRRLAPVAAGAE